MFLNFFIYLFTPLIFNSTPSYSITASSTDGLNMRSLSNTASSTTDVSAYSEGDLFICAFCAIAVSFIIIGTIVLMASQTV